MIALSSVFGYVTSPDFLLNSFNPRAAIPPALETRVLLENEAGFLAGTAFLQIVLLRLKSKDITVWKCLQTSIGIVDTAIIVAMLRSLAAQGRSSPADWRWQESASLAFTGAVLLTRVLFVLGIGVKAEPKNKRT